MSGITYYKLSKDIYPGDTTKGCGLTGPEIDENFHFLRGYGIKDGELNPDNGIIALYRLNGEKIEIEGLAEFLSGITADVSLDESYFDPINGTLHMFVNGVEECAISGFTSCSDINVDCTLEGDGSKENPLKIAKEFVDGIHSEIKEAIDVEKNAREEADKSIDSELKDIISGVARDLHTQIRNTKNELNSAIEDEAAERKNAVSGLSVAISTVNTEISAITDSISELGEKVADVALTKNVAISENSPLYQFISGIWEDNVIPSGTTFTEFVEKLCSSDTRMIYYIDTPLSDIDDVVENFDDLKSAAAISDVSVSFKGTMGAHIIGIALPKPHNLLSAISTQNGFTQRITDKFFINPARDVISEGIVYTLYYYKINVGLRSSDNFTITLS